MRINALNNGYQPSFAKGKSFLYTDFDGTLLAQPLDDIYNGNTSQKRAAVGRFNAYFSQIQEFIDSKKGKFEILISTGRRLEGDSKEGFKPTLDKMQQEGIHLPKIKSLITTSGGDVYNFNQDGTLSATADISKAKAIKEQSGWDNEEIKTTLDEISKKLNTEYKFTNNRGSYKLSIDIKDKSKLEAFHEELKSALSKKMQFKSKISEIKVNKNGLKLRANGIKLEPTIDGHSIHKDFDVKLALKRAIKDNDLVIFAGDADNDKEALNIFRYIQQPQGYKPPKNASEITENYVNLTKGQIDKLPLKLLFIKPEGKMDSKTIALYNFMNKTAQLFPDKIEMVEPTQVGVNNHFLDSVKKTVNNFEMKNIKNYFKENIGFIFGIVVLIIGGAKIIYDDFIKPRLNRKNNY